MGGQETGNIRSLSGGARIVGSSLLQSVERLPVAGD